MRDDEDRKLLPEEQAVKFHHTAAQLLFLYARAWRDIQTAVAFLTTRVKELDKDNWGKLKRVILYLNGTRRMKLRLTIEDLAIIKWWINGSHNVHPDMRGHTGGMMRLVEGAIVTYLPKHKINTQSSTESEVVASIR